MTLAQRRRMRLRPLLQQMGQNGQGNFVGRFTANVQPDGGVQAL